MKIAKHIALAAALLLSGHAGAVTTHLLVNFEGSLDESGYTLGAGEIGVLSQ